MLLRVGVHHVVLFEEHLRWVISILLGILDYKFVLHLLYNILLLEKVFAVLLLGLGDVNFTIIHDLYVVVLRLGQI